MATIKFETLSFKKTLNFCRKYFKKVRVVENEYSDMAHRSQNFFKIILFENRGTKFSIKWNYSYCTLFLGDITKSKKTLFQFSFTKMRIDECYPVEEGNNLNVMFWEYDLTGPYDERSQPISPLRMPVSKSEK